MRVKWTWPAAEHLRGIRLFIQPDSPSTARKISRTILERCELFSDFPERGRIGIEPGTRERIFAPPTYIAAYRIKGDLMEILHVWHGAQDRSNSPTP